MLTGDLVRVRVAKQRVVPLYLDREAPHWLEAAESLLLLYREGAGMTRGELGAEINELFGGSGGKATPGGLEGRGGCRGPARSQGPRPTGRRRRSARRCPPPRPTTGSSSAQRLEGRDSGRGSAATRCSARSPRC